jgi:4-hydroxy-4-methyl-2-oxoglutarate aldolase
MTDMLLTLEELETLRAIPTPAISNAIEPFDIRPRNAGFMGPEVRQMFPSLQPIIGYAVTARTKSAYAPDPDRTVPRPDYWRYLAASGPGPLIAVIEDLDEPPSIGAFFGEVNSNIHRALGCVGAITNSGIRDMEEVEALGFPIWAGSVVVSHAYVHLVDFGGIVKVGGLVVRPGDLLMADGHGVIQIPPALVGDLPDSVRRVEARERTIISYCQSPDFNVEGLVELVAKL